MIPCVKIFLGKVLSKLRMWRATTGMVITMTILLLYVRFRITIVGGGSVTMIPILILLDKKFFKNWQVNTSEVNLDSYGEHEHEERITGSKI